MPKVTLAVCIYREGDLLARQLDHAEGCYDELVVVHDGPDDTNVRAIVEAHGGRFYERPRAYQQEPHWPFAWGQARNDWVLRWDADEFPSPELCAWLIAFRAADEPPAEVSGYTAIIPLWDGRRERTRRWPHRVVLVNRQRVRYFGMADQAPIADGRFEPLDVVLHHQPDRPSYGIWYTLKRPTSRRWHAEIARALLGKPTDLACWRWDDPVWPAKWEAVRRAPLRTGLRRLLLSPIGNARSMIRAGEFPNPELLTFFPLQHWMTCWQFHRARKAARDAR